MSETFEIAAVSREESGKGAIRRLRRTGAVPAVIYGGESEPANISLRDNELRKHLESEAFYSHLLTVTVDGKGEQVILKDLQRHPFRQEVMHVDFLRVVAGEALTTNVTLHFINEEQCAGVKEGGVVQHVVTEVEIRCLPKHLPEYIEVDMAAVELGGNIHLSEIQAPEGVELLALAHGEDLTVANVAVPKAAPVEDDAAAAEGDEGEAATEE